MLTETVLMRMSVNQPVISVTQMPLVLITVTETDLPVLVMPDLKHPVMSALILTSALIRALTPAKTMLTQIVLMIFSERVLIVNVTNFTLRTLMVSVKTLMSATEREHLSVMLKIKVNA